MPGALQHGHNEAEEASPYIPHSRPLVGDDEAFAVRAVIDSGFLAQGPRVAELEAGLVEHLGLPSQEPTHGVAVSSGTAALYVALRALGVSEGDEILVPAYVCTSVAQAVRHVGATPHFIDCDPNTLNPDPADAEKKVTPKTAATVIAHLFGLPADLEAFLELGPPLIEDCAQTLGANYRGRVVGTIGEASVYSFYATKLLAAGEGGMMVSARADLIERARGLRDCEAGTDDGTVEEWAFNFKMTDLQAAIGLVQLERLPELLARRQLIAELYRNQLSDLPVTLPPQPDDRDHQYFRFVVSVEPGSLPALLERSERLGLACRRPVGLLPSPVLEQLDELPGCRQAWENACSVPLYPALSDEEVGLAISRFRAAFEGADG